MCSATRRLGAAALAALGLALCVLACDAPAQPVKNKPLPPARQNRKVENLKNAGQVNLQNGDQGDQQNGQNGDQGEKQNGQAGDQGEKQNGQAGDQGEKQNGQAGDQGEKENGQNGKQAVGEVQRIVQVKQLKPGQVKK
jgi:hypothetical protein